MTVSPWSFYLSDFFTLSLQQFVSYSSGHLTSTLVPIDASVLVSCVSLYSSVCLSSLEGSVLPCDLNSLMELERVVDFFSFFFFSFLLFWMR